MLLHLNVEMRDFAISQSMKKLSSFILYLVIVNQSKLLLIKINNYTCYY
jgi:hypothetical protein